MSILPARCTSRTQGVENKAHCQAIAAQRRLHARHGVAVDASFADVIKVRRGEVGLWAMGAPVYALGEPIGQRAACAAQSAIGPRHCMRSDGYHVKA